MAEGSSEGHERRLILTPDQRLRVFVSSTLRELAEERAAVRDVIAHLSLTPVMFELGARPHPPRALYRSYLDQSHVFIGIYWESYGWVAPEEAVSGIEDEYQLSDRLPRLLYVKEPAAGRDPRLAALLERIQEDDVASYRPFETAEELTGLVTDDLMLLLSEQFQAAIHESSMPDHRDIRLTPPSEPLTPLLGRDDELAALKDLVAGGTRLLTVTGAGGIGKSRLVDELAHRCTSELAIDIHFVDLTPVASPEAVPAEVAKSLGIPLEGTRGAIATLTDHLADRRLLMILDNFEHVAAAGVALLDLLSSCPQLQLLVTSRHLLRLRGETEYPLAPLPIPPADASDEAIRANPTVQLFAQRAQAAQPGFLLTPDNLAPVAEICRRLDGLPLAVELAAARVRLLSPDLLLHRLESRLDLLSAGAADLPERQRTLRTAIDWSYNLLSPSEQALFDRLAVFVDGWTLAAAEAVCATADEDVLDTLVSLLEKSLLVIVGPTPTGEPRMRMLAPVHQFAAQKLAARGEHDLLQHRLADYFGELVVQRQDELRGAGQEDWSAQLSAERGNLGSVVQWWLNTQDGEALGRFIFATHLHFWLTGTLREFAEWVDAAAPYVDAMTTHTRGCFKLVDAFLYLDRNDLDRALQHAEDGLSLLETEDDQDATDLGRIIRALILNLRGDPAAAEAIGGLLAGTSAPEDPWLLAMAHWTAGGAAMFAGDLERAAFHHDQAVALGRDLGNWQVVGQGLGRLAYVHLLAGNTAAAAEDLKTSAECFRRVHYREGLAYDLSGFATLLAALGDPFAAAEALSAADSCHRLIGVPMWSVFRPAFEALREQLTAQLADEFTDAWTSGAKPDVYAATDRALGAVARASATSVPGV